MRLGHNSPKDKPQLTDYLRHRVIIPVYIPTMDGYYKDSLEILKLCLESLYLTGAGKMSITVISNNSTSAVVKELERLYQLEWIDQLLLNKKNRGKVDAVSSAARGAFEELITIADCDVLFKTGWIEAIEAIFHNFPECGFAAPMPNPGQAWANTSATILGALKNRELRFDKVVPDADLNGFAHSLGYQDQDKYLAEHRHAQMIVRRKDTTACVGCGHFVFTARGKVVQGMPKHPSLSAISGHSEERWLDMPPDRLGFWRLATTRAYVHHMGNSLESWMYDELEITRRSHDPSVSPQFETLPEIQKSWISKLPWRFRRGLVWTLKRPTFSRMLIPTPAPLKTQ